MIETHSLFTGFIGRDSDLRAIPRYHIYPVMLYRTDLLIHSQRTAWLVREIHPFAKEVFGSEYDPHTAELLALVHDDAEIVMGDIQAGIKGKMTAAQLIDVDHMERRAIDGISARFPKTVGDHNYRELLLDNLEHTSLEAQVVQFADKFDALGEALHEVYAGNHVFITHVVNEYGKISLPTDYYFDYFDEYLRKFPAMAPLLATSSPLFRAIPRSDFTDIVAKSDPHTEESFALPTGYWPYDVWKDITNAHGSPHLLTQTLTPSEELPTTRPV